MDELELQIAPEDGVAVPAGVPPVVVDATYPRLVVDSATGASSAVQDTERIALDPGLRGALAVPDVAPEAVVELSFLGASGAVRLRRSVSVEARPLQVALTAAEVAAVTAPEPQPAPPAPTIDRRAYFVEVGEGRVPFRLSKLQVAPLRVADGGWTAAGLDAVFHADGPRTTSIEWAEPLAPALAAADWQPVRVGVDGRFSFTVPRAAGDAWAFWLAGPRPALGVVLDDLALARPAWLAVALPPFAAPADDDVPGVPKDVTEGEVADNPDVYTEDPGAYCQPFKNPERVLGERSFFVILRAEQPVISAEATVRTEPVPALTFERAPDPSPTGLGAAAPSFAAALQPVLVRHAVPAAYLDMLAHHQRGRASMDAAHPLQWEADASRYQATTVARGHILELRMRWRSNGYSLGTVAKTLTLAPRQTKRIQKIEWERRETARRLESTQLTDRVSDSLTQERHYEDAVRANLSEWARGESTSSTAAAAGGFGFAGPGFVVGGGGGGSRAHSESSQEGGRVASASEEQRLRDSVRRYGDSLRRLESMVVTEVAQEESVTGTTEVVRNVNYGHALTVIYYQILRHLKIETGVAGVRECLFVPLPITPFTVGRAYRWREFLERGLRDARYRDALRYLRDVLQDFSGSDVPPGRRSDQEVRYVTGSLFLRLAVERPADKADGAYEPAAWTVLNPYLGVPSRSIFARLAALAEARRDAAFQKEQAPTIASRWVDKLQLKASGVALAADFTLASRYQFNGEVRVDFTVAAPVGVTRETLSKILVEATEDLTPGSVANVRALTYTYQTDQYERRVQGAQGQGDLVQPETGARDPLGATFGLPPDAWERQDVRKEMKSAVYAFVEHLNEHVEHYHKAVWWSLDRDRLFMMIDGFYAPGADGLSVASVVERDPIAIVGNSLVFRVAAGSFLGVGDLQTPAQLRNYYVAKEAPSDPMLVSLPTDGLYAQTVMDECGAVEEHFGSTDWVLNDPDPELGTIAPELLATRRAEPGGTTPTAFPQTIINLQNAPDMPAPSGLADALTAATNANAFRDMAGLAGTQANAAGAFQTAASLATTFGQQAAAIKLAEIAAKAQATQSADQKLASVQRAQDKQLIGPDEAQRQAAKILEEMNAPSTATKPHQDETMMEAARAAMGQPGSIIETATGDGTFRVQLAGFPTPNGGGGGAVTSEPFPAQPYALTFDTANPKLNTAMAAIKAQAKFKDMCGAVVDLTGSPTDPPYAGFNDDDMVYTGSLPKILAYYAAFELRHRVREHVKAAGVSTATTGWEKPVIADIEKAWKPKLDAKFPGLAKGFPRIGEIFAFSPAGVDFKTSGTSQADLDAIVQGPVTGLGFLECMKLTMQYSSPHGVSRLVRDLGYPFLNGTLRDAGFFRPKTSTSDASGVWLSADYRGNDWPNASIPLTARWAKAQKLPSRPDGRSNIVTSARGVARLMALVGLDRLVDAPTSRDMRAVAAPGDRIGRRVQRALDDAAISHTALFSKGGHGDDARNHDCAVIERTLANGTTIRYAVVGFGWKKGDDADLFALFVALDAAVASLH